VKPVKFDKRYAPKPTVVLIHGLGRTARTFGTLRNKLEQRGFATWARSYPSHRLTPQQAASHLRQRLHAELPPGPVVGVTHSLGGIVARFLGDTIHWDSLVMVAPPNQGSRLARAAEAHKVTRLFTGPSGRALAQPDNWPSPPARFAVIAGTQPGPTEQAHAWFGRRSGAFGPRDKHDGVVHVDEARHPEADAFATVQAGHNFLMDNKDVQAMILSWLETGRL
jgi:pimeloyl-ACP methyl ester carboxylesterase